MMAGVRGRLLTASFAQNILPTLPGATNASESVARAIAAWSTRRHASLGPASAVRAIADVAVIPLLNILGFDVATRVDDENDCHLGVRWRETPTAPVVVVPWGESLDHAWRRLVLKGISVDARWCFSCNGTALRIIDAQRTWLRHYLEFDLDLLAEDTETLNLLWTLARSEALAPHPAFLDRAVDLSARHGVAVCRALGDGVLDALKLLMEAVPLNRTRQCRPQALFEQSLTVLYRVLFLLFAEARGLVPMWHPVYRDRYSIDTIVTTLLAGRRYRGVWPAVQAISRLAHAGCSAGELKVTAFNGRLFSPARAPVFDGGTIADDVMGRAVMAVSTTAASPDAAPSRIMYGDLDVEQLGAVYEHVLEYEPTSGLATDLHRSRDARKASGTFYTPRSVTAFLVRRTLEPLVKDRCADDILRVRVVDPAMGSGAFLVEACRYLAGAAEDALIREGRWHPGDILPADRTAIRRDIAQRCLYGVDLNPMAVQLARLSLWLATLAADKPLTFLDHRLVAGDSLVGATPLDVQRQPSRDGLRRGRHASLPLFDQEQLAPALEEAVRTRQKLALEPDDSAAIVHDKERALAALLARDGRLGRWSRVLDLWCAGWFWDGQPPSTAAFGELAGLLLRDRSSLPTGVASTLLQQAEVIATDHRFIHWPLVFPENFVDEHGAPTTNPGFDAVIGNPPWDMVRGDSGETGTRTLRRQDAQRLTDFVREAGIYPVESRSHVNRYQLFVQRAIQLARRGGRIGLVLPSGFTSDSGAAPLRRYLFDHAAIDSITGLDNRNGIFPIHRSVRFALLTCTSGPPTSSVDCRFGITSLEQLDKIDHASAGSRPGALVLTRHLLGRIGGDDDLGIPELSTRTDLRILEKISAHIPWLGAPDGWNVRFGRELNATDDRHWFVDVTGNPDARPVLEGKQIEPFRVLLDECRHEVIADAAARIRVPHRARLAYRDVASATNRLTLIAAIVPAQAVTTHTLFCLKTSLPMDAQHALCALLNSFVANYLIRLRVNTHVTASLMSRLPVPLVHEKTSAFTRLASLSRRLMTGKAPVEEMPEYAELQALAARLYGLHEAEFQHILATFPLIAGQTKSTALTYFERFH